MRSISLPCALVAAIAVAGCGSDAAQSGGGSDLAVPDMTAGDMVTPTSCNPTDPLSGVKSRLV